MKETKQIKREKNWYSKYGPLIRGDQNKDGTKIFWGYLLGKEMWVSKKRFSEACLDIKMFS